MRQFGMMIGKDDDRLFQFVVCSDGLYPGECQPDVLCGTLVIVQYSKMVFTILSNVHPLLQKGDMVQRAAHSIARGVKKGKEYNEDTMASFDHLAGQAFLRDGFVPFKDANLSIASSPVLYGLCVYTVFSVNWNETDKKRLAFRLKDHYRRLANSAAIMDLHNFAPAWPYERFEATMKELIERNNIEGEDVLVRLAVFADAIIAGTKIHGLPHELSGFIYPMGQILPRSGINVCVSSWTHNFDNAIPSRAKVNGGYVNNCLMKNEALMNGYDDAIALDVHGNVAEGTVANLFIVRNGVLITPAVNVDILEGITRASIIAIARDAGIPVEERPVHRTELYIADEAFISGSSARLTPVLSVDKRPVGASAAAVNGTPASAGVIGPVTKLLAEKYEAAQRGTDGGKWAAWRTEL